MIIFLKAQDCYSPIRSLTYGDDVDKEGDCYILKRSVGDKSSCSKSLKKAKQVVENNNEK